MEDDQTPSQAMITHRAFWMPKRGHAEIDYEDAYAVSAHGMLPCRAAVADGATESAFARLWARTLVKGFVDEGTTDPEVLVDKLPYWQAVWIETVEQRSRPLPWYAEQKVDEGAYATLLGIELQPEGKWRGLAVGDCCLFQLREDTVIEQWPVKSPEAFTNRPALVPSRTGYAVPDPQVHSGTWSESDRLVLATDATAAWLMQTGLAEVLRADAETLRKRVRAARSEGTLRNDDVTLLELRILA